VIKKGCFVSKSTAVSHVPEAHPEIYQNTIGDGIFRAEARRSLRNSVLENLRPLRLGGENGTDPNRPDVIIDGAVNFDTVAMEILV
jgi:hypothetical protein